MASIKATSKDAGPNKSEETKPEAPSMLSYIRAMMEYDKELMAKPYEECVKEGLTDDADSTGLEVVDDDKVADIPLEFKGASILDYSERDIDHSKTLLGERFLCEEGAMLFIGPSGIGKSSASVQQDLLWACGRAAFGIDPSRPLKIFTCQAENDDGDVIEAARGTVRGVTEREGAFTQEERDLIMENTHIEPVYSMGDEFLEYIEQVINERELDILRIDPLGAFAGFDLKNEDYLQPWLNRCRKVSLNTGCAIIINHHTPKTSNRNTDDWKANDWMYAGAGSAALTNWARAILVIDPIDRKYFKFIGAKRGRRLGWQDEVGHIEDIQVFKHAENTIYWEAATHEDKAETEGKATGPACGGRGQGWDIDELKGWVERMLEEKSDIFSSKSEMIISLANFIESNIEGKAPSEKTLKRCISDVLDRKIVVESKFKRARGSIAIGSFNAIQLVDDETEKSKGQPSG
jgi:hypothetical protein